MRKVMEEGQGGYEVIIKSRFPRYQPVASLLARSLSQRHPGIAYDYGDARTLSDV